MMRLNNKSRRGNALIEFALAGGLLATLITSGFRFGYGFYAYNVLQGAVAAGARHASLRTYDSSTATPSATFSTAVGNMVVYGHPAGGTTPVIPGLTPANVQVSVVMNGGAPHQVRVSIVNYNLNALGDWSLDGKPFAQFRYVGRLAP